MKAIKACRTILESSLKGLSGKLSRNGLAASIFEEGGQENAEASPSAHTQHKTVLYSKCGILGLSYRGDVQGAPP